ELSKTLARRKPVLGDEAQDHPASTGGRTQSLAPFIPARYAVMIDKNIGEAIGFEPCLERRRTSVVLPRMTYEKDRHLPIAPHLNRQHRRRAGDCHPYTSRLNS